VGVHGHSHIPECLSEGNQRRVELIWALENWPGALLVNEEISPGFHGCRLRELDLAHIPAAILSPDFLGPVSVFVVDSGGGENTSRNRDQLGGRVNTESRL
jgi:hypothetical protein